MSGEGTRQVLIHAGETLESTTLEPKTLASVAAQLESATYDLALAIMRWEEERGSTRESRAARETLACIDERLLWVERNLSEIEIDRKRDELQTARLSALDIVALLSRDGIDVPRTEPGLSPRLLHRV